MIAVCKDSHVVYVCGFDRVGKWEWFWESKLRCKNDAAKMTLQKLRCKMTSQALTMLFADDIISDYSFNSSVNSTYVSDSSTKIYLPLLILGMEWKYFSTNTLIRLYFKVWYIITIEVFSKSLCQTFGKNLKKDMNKWINSKCIFDIFGKLYKITKNIIYQVKISDRNHRYCY